MDVVLLAAVVGALLGLALGALGGGGSILAVPALVYLFDQGAAEATTGSLVVVGVTAIIGAVSAHRLGNVMLGRGVAFGVLAIGGAAVGAKAAAEVDDDVLLASFAALMLVIGALMAVRAIRGRHGDDGPHAGFDEPIISFSPTFACACPRAVKLLVTATAVGLLTGFLGVGGGFLVVPALVLSLGLPMNLAAGTSLVVIAITSGSALAVRSGLGVQPDWAAVVALTVAAGVAAVAGTRVAARTDTRRLQGAFTVLVLLVATYTAAQAFPALA